MAMSRIESRRRLVKALQRDAAGINPQLSDVPVLPTGQKTTGSKLSSAKQKHKSSKSRPRTP
jgi:hypothetical protein